MTKLPLIPYRLLEQNNKEKNTCLDLSDKLRILSKTTINFLVKGKTDIVRKNLPVMDKLFKKMRSILRKNPHLYGVSGINIGLEEYLEALFVHSYIKNRSMPNINKLETAPEVYLGGLSDMTGVLVRLARRENKQAAIIHDYIAKIYDLIIPISITKNSNLRMKLETIGNNLKKIEDIIYDLKLRDKI